MPRSQAETRLALQSKVDSTTRALAEHGKEMAWVAKYVCEPLGPELAQKAMEGYLASKSKDWKKENARLRGEFVESCTKLVRHMFALNKIAPALAPSIRQQWEAISEDPVASQAIIAALENDPNLINGDGLKEVAGLLATLKKESGPTGKLAFLIVRMTNVAATAFLRRTVLEKLNGLKPGDPAAAAKITEALAGLRNKWFAKILGFNLNAAELDQAIGLVTKASTKYASNAALLEKGFDPAGIKQLDQAVAKEFLDGTKQLESRIAAFNGATLAGRMMKSLVVTVALGLNFYVSYQATMEKPSGVKVARTVDLGLLGAQRASDLLVSLGVDSTSIIGRYAAAKLGDVPGIGRLAGKLGGAKLAGVPLGEVYLQIYAVLEAVGAVGSAGGWWGFEKDAVQAGLSGASAIGFGLAFAPSFGAAAWTGPVGMVVAAAAACGQIIYDDVKDAHQYEKASEICLKAAGFTDLAAAKFSRQGPYATAAAGAAQIPFLAQYAAFRGVSVLTLVNELTVEKAIDASGKVEIDGWGSPIYRENADRVNSLSDAVLDAMKEGVANPTMHRDGQRWAGAALQKAQPSVPQVSPEEASKTIEKSEMGIFEHVLVRDGVLTPGKVMPRPFWENP